MLNFREGKRGILKQRSMMQLFFFGHDCILILGKKTTSRVLRFLNYSPLKINECPLKKDHFKTEMSSSKYQFSAGYVSFQGGNTSTSDDGESQLTNSFPVIWSIQLSQLPIEKRGDRSRQLCYISLRKISWQVLPLAPKKTKSCQAIIFETGT